MSLRKLPDIKAIAGPKGLSWDVPSDALARWTEMPQAAADNRENTITIYDVIGADPWTGGGFTAKRMDAALRTIGSNDVTVLVNSPGGDLAEGLTIYNLLARHPARVTVEVLGMAASAASVIAMAGDEISMALGSMMMIHNAWGMVVGNRGDLADAIAVLERFDGGMIDIYEARTGRKRGDIAAMMDAETFMTAKEAVENGFADTVSDGISASAQAAQLPHVSAKRKLDALLARSGMSRSERRRLMQEAAGGTHDAAPAVTHDAGLDVAAVSRLIETIKT